MKFRDLLLNDGWCCPYAFFHANRKIRTGLLAARIGVHESTIKSWRRFYSKGQIYCESGLSCLKTSSEASNSPKRRGG